MRALNVKEASQAPSNNIRKVKFIARRNQHGLAAGDVTAQVMSLPINTVQRLITHQIVALDPPSNFKMWGKDVAAWLLKHHREHPVTMQELVAAQVAMAAEDVDSLPVSAAWVASEKARVEAEAKQAADDVEAKAAAKRHADEAAALAKSRAALKAETERKAAGKPVDEDSEDGADESTQPAPDESEGNLDASTESASKPKRAKKK